MARHVDLLSFLAAGFLLVTGCDKGDSKTAKKDGDGKADKVEQAKADEPAASPPKDTGPFADFDLPSLSKKWQGTWLVQGGRVVWHIEGDELTIADGKGENASRGFEVQAPCQVASIERVEGGSSSTYHKFAFDGDTLYTGLGNAGVKKDDVAVACVSNKIYVLRDGKCVSWRQTPFDKSKWESSEAECSISDETFQVEGTTLEVVGEALLDAQMKRNAVERKSSLAEAQAALQ